MFLQRLINSFLIGLICLISLSSFSQAGDSTVIIQSPYKNEYNPWFKFTKFQRGFAEDSLKHFLDDLEATPRKEWSRKDSLNFARASLQTGNIDLSEYYFSHLNVDFDSEQSYWWDQIMIPILNQDYEGGIESIHKCSPGILEHTKIYFLDRILLAYLAEQKDGKWHKSHSVLKWEIDSTLMGIDKNDERFQTEIIRPLNNLNFVLRHLIHYIHESDPIIARICFEMGTILEQHVSWTQAYIAYSLGRNYNKWDKEILNQIKEVKAKLSKNKYKIPIFRRYFPRIEKWRFEYEVLKEKIILQKQDTINKQHPVLMVKKEENKMPIAPEIIIVAGIGLTFLLVLLFLKTRKH